MRVLQNVGRDASLGRELFVLEARSPDDVPGELRLSSSRFVVIVVWDARGASAEEVSHLARRLLDAGAVYVCAWGPDCERVHDIVDEERDTAGHDAEGIVMTTWHEHESLAEALWFVLTAAVPDDAYVKDCGAIVGISIGSAEWASEIRAAFSSPSEFVAMRAKND